jgi:prepilin-type N-terminal cleavage/methylation domain-containing protein/prepilin-type processing-associated H-X9-DG protein
MSKHKQQCTYRTGAFTLIELLVVIAIIAILASILFPVFGRARENARRSSCQSNLKQIGLGVLQYQQDFDEKMPMRFGGGRSWRVAVQPYIKSTQLFLCPSNTHTKLGAEYSEDVNQNDVLDTAAGEVALIPRGYQAPTEGLAATGIPPTAWQSEEGRAISAFQYPSTTIMVAEGGGSDASFSDLPLGNAGWAFARGANPNNGIFSGHLNTSNFLFVDGHVKSMRPTATLNEAPGVDSQRKDMWTLDNVPLTGAAFTSVQNKLLGSEEKYK